MPEQLPTKTPDENTGSRQAPLRIDVPKRSERRELDFVDEGSLEEEPEGYGYGV